MLHRFVCLVVCCTFVLIVAGGMVTSTSSGLSVPDWPTTYGYSMFSFPLSKMVGGIFYEHGHRLIASTVGFLTIVLAIWLQVQEPRRTVRRLGWLALGAVVLQGTLGGITVLFFLPAAVSIGHAGLAQIFFCLLVTIGVLTSRGWLSRYGDAGRSLPDARLPRWTAALTVLIYGQILVGATMRHTGAGLAIPDFPLAFGALVPPTWTGAIAIHYAHRVGAMMVAGAVFALAAHLFSRHADRRELTRPMWLLSALVVLQIGLGAWTVLRGKVAEINTAHGATGALVHATSVVLTLHATRARCADERAGARRAAPAARIESRPPVGARA
jgi:cytochrome c oxidase assembly protein subunit 15